MDDNPNLGELLKELSNAISRSLSSPETIGKLEKLQQQGYQLYLVMEPSSGEISRQGNSPVMPIQIFHEGPDSKPTRSFELTAEDKDFLRTLKIKVD
jgi:hypothetical protein